MLSRLLTAGSDADSDAAPPDAVAAADRPGTGKPGGARLLAPGHAFVRAPAAGDEKRGWREAEGGSGGGSERGGVGRTPTPPMPPPLPCFGVAVAVVVVVDAVTAVLSYGNGDGDGNDGDGWWLSVDAAVGLNGERNGRASVCDTVSSRRRLAAC